MSDYFCYGCGQHIVGMHACLSTIKNKLNPPTYEDGYRQGIEDAVKVAQKICNKESGVDVQFMILEAIKILLKKL